MNKGSRIETRTKAILYLFSTLFAFKSLCFAYLLFFLSHLHGFDATNSLFRMLIWAILAEAALAVIALLTADPLGRRVRHRYEMKHGVIPAS